MLDIPNYWQQHRYMTRRDNRAHPSITRPSRLLAGLVVGGVSLVCIASLIWFVGFLSVSDVDPADYPATSPPRLSQGEYLTQYAACMESRGWLLSVDYDEGSTRLDEVLRPDQPDTFVVDGNSCDLAVEPVKYTYNDLSLGDRREAYSRFTSARSCLAGLGFDMPEPPSFKIFDDGGAMWTPFEDIPRTQLRVAEQTCPQPVF